MWSKCQSQVIKYVCIGLEGEAWHYPSRGKMSQSNTSLSTDLLRHECITVFLFPHCIKVSRFTVAVSFVLVPSLLWLNFSVDSILQSWPLKFSCFGRLFSDVMEDPTIHPCYTGAQECLVIPVVSAWELPRIYNPYA